MKTKLKEKFRRMISALTDFQNVMIAVIVIVIIALFSADYLIRISYSQDEELESRNRPDTADVPSSQSEDSFYIRDFVPEQQTEAQKQADTRVFEHPESDLTKPFANGDWEAGIAGIKAMIAGVNTRSGSDPFQMMTGTADPVDGNSRWQGAGRGLSWHMAYPTGPYVICEVRVTEYDTMTLVEATHSYEFGRARGEKPYPGRDIRKVRTHEIMLGKPNGKLDFVSAELRTENCRTDGLDSEDLDRKAATGHLCQILRYIEEHSKAAR